MPTMDTWPRRCGGCRREHFRNPIPVAVVVIPIIGGGVLTVRRSVPPAAGKLALPGGFVNWGETWQQGAVREIEEEIGIYLMAESLLLLDAVSVSEGAVLIFSASPPQNADILEKFVPNEEVSEVKIIDEAVELAFPTHTAMLQRFLQRR